MKRPLCLDLDGVLADTGDWHRMALERAVWETSVGRGLVFYSSALRSRDQIARYCGDDVQIDAIYARKFDHLAHIAQEAAVLARRGLADLTANEIVYKAAGHPVCIVTATLEHAARPMIEALTGQTLEALRWEISARQTIDDPDKPSPSLYSRALQLLHAEGRDVSAVEDTDRGADAARSAGIAEIVVVESPREALEWLSVLN